MLDERKPQRLHHTAYVTRDLAAIRAFYEDIIGLPLVATWAEREDLFGKVRTYCHVFFGLEDGSALAFFQFADQDDAAEFGPKMAETPFHHIALNVSAETQAGIERRLAAAGYTAPGPDHYILEHGYCRSVYVKDPSGMLVEFTVDDADAIADAPRKAKLARQELDRWLGGDHTPNNDVRGEKAH